MKKSRFLALLMALCLLLQMPIMAADAADENTDYSALRLQNNAHGNSIQGVGMSNSPDQSFLIANEDGGYTVVQYVPSLSGVVAADFDQAFSFLRSRVLPTEGIQKWGGFCADETYRFVCYSTSGTTLHVDQYTADWTLNNAADYTLSNTKSFISNDFDVTAGGGSLYIVSNHYMENGHMSNMRLQINAATLARMASHTGEAGAYDGYVSHSYVPEVVYSSGMIYAFDRVDSFPAAGLFVTGFEGGFFKGKSMSTVPGLGYNDWRAWGNLGNAVPAANSGFVAACNYAPYDDTDTSSYGLNRCNVYLTYGCYSGSSLSMRTQQVNFDGGAGIPWVVATDSGSGVVLWDPGGRSGSDRVSYAIYTVSGGNIYTGAVQTAENCYISDCEPIADNGDVIWFTVQGDLRFYRLHNGVIEQKQIHRWDEGKTTKQPTCTDSGLFVTTCLSCGETIEKTIPAAGHQIERVEEVSPDCRHTGTAAHYACNVCGKCFSDAAGTAEVTAEDLMLPVTEHQWDSGTVSAAPTESAEGVMTYTCTVCGETRTETIEKLPPAPTPTPTPKPTATPAPTPKPTVTPTPTPKPTATPTPTPKPTATPAPTPKPTATPAPTPKPTATPAPTPKPTATPAPTPKPTATPAPTPKPTATPAPTPKPTATPAPTPKPTTTPAPTETPAPALKNPFKDVAKDQYYYDPVLWAVNQTPQITAGTSATTFSPAATCTRGQVVTFLWRAAGEPKPAGAKNPFTDVKSGDYFYSAVLWAVEKGITQGTSATTFSPNAPCTRAHVVTFLWRSEGQSRVDAKNPFGDVKSGDYYYSAVLWAVKNEITAGTSATTFSPNNPCTRGQIVTFLYRDKT